MPTLFDSHEEFNEWFSKDIESHALAQTALNERTLFNLCRKLIPRSTSSLTHDSETLYVT